MIYERSSWRPYDLERAVTIVVCLASIAAVQYHYLALATLLLLTLIVFLLYCRAAWD